MSGLSLPPLLCLLLALACRAEPAGSEADRYLRVVTDEALELEEGQRLCGSLGDSDLRGDCMLALVGHVADRGEGERGELCRLVPEGTWRDECWFLAAEHARRAGQRELAAARCLESGRFRDDCGQHLWQSALRATIAPRAKGAALPTYAEAIPRAEQLYRRWAPLLEEGTDMELRFWRRFYQNGFERRGWIEVARCDELEEPHAARCVAAAQHLYVQRLDTDLPRLRMPLCELRGHRGPAEQALRAAAHPALDEALLQRQAERCRPAGGGVDAPGG